MSRDTLEGYTLWLTPADDFLRQALTDLQSLIAKETRTPVFPVHITLTPVVPPE
jgi:hypothetical protein